MKNVNVIIGVIVVGLGAAYMISDPVRAKVQHGFSEFAEWTPTRIEENREGYLQYLDTKTKDAIKKLRAEKIGNMQSLSRMKAKEADAVTKVGSAKEALEALKDLHRTGIYPATWKTLSFADEGKLKSGVVSLGRDIQNWEKKLSAYGLAKSRLEKNDQKINASTQQAETLVAEIDTNLELIAIEEIGNDIDEILFDMGAAVASVDAVANQPATISVEGVSDVIESGEDNAFFQELMGQ